jgi:hypothetical protein
MLMRRKWRWIVVGLILTIAVILGVLSAYPGPTAPLTDLKDIEDLRAQFNQDKGAPRLVLLLSPT